jgi:hypothetical protein
MLDCGFGIVDLGFGIVDLGFGIVDLGLWIWDLGFRIALSPRSSLLTPHFSFLIISVSCDLIKDFAATQLRQVFNMVAEIHIENVRQFADKLFGNGKRVKVARL